MNLVSKENSRAELHYSIILCVTLVFEVEREVIVVAEKAEKDAKKVQAEENKQRKEAEAQEKAVQRQVGNDLKAAAAAEKLAAKEAKKK